MDPKVKKILRWTVIVLVIIAIILLIWWLWRPQPPVVPVEEPTVDNQPRFDLPSVPLEPVEILPEQNAEFTVTNLAKSYANWFGSWSTDNQGQNLQELNALSTNRMKNYLAAIQVNYDNQEFSGLTTKALSAEVEQMDSAETQATVSVTAQRIETKQDLSTNVYYQQAEVELVKTGDQWLVDSFVWEQ